MQLTFDTHLDNNITSRRTGAIIILNYVSYPRTRAIPREQPYNEAK